MPSPAVTVNGTLQTLLGVATAGTVTFTLEDAKGALPRVSGTSVLVPVTTSVSANGSGFFTAVLFGNDVITPNGTFYMVSVRDSAGQLLSSAPYSFTGSGSYDLSSATPLISSSSSSLVSASVLLSPTTSQTISGYPLNVSNLNSIRFADQFSGADIGAKINAAVADVGSTGGIIFVPQGTYNYSTQILLDDKRGITLVGAGGVTSGSAGATELIYTGTGIPVSARSTTALRLTGLQLFENNASFANTVLDLSHSGSATDTTYAEVDHCSFYCSNGALASVVISLDQAINSSVHHCALQNYTVGIRGSLNNTRYSNVIEIRRNNFSSSTGTAVTAHVQNPGQAWDISNNTYEMGTALGSPAVIGYTSTSVSPLGVHFTGNWIGDNTSGAAQTLITVQGGGWDISGNFIAGPVTNGTTAISFLNSVTGANVAGNFFTNHAAAYAFASNNTNIVIGANTYSTVSTLYTGTPSKAIVQSLTGVTSIYGGANVAGVSLSSQVAAIGSTVLMTSPPAGTYRISWYGFTSGTGTGTTATFSTTYGDGASTKTFTSAKSWSLATADYDTGSIVVRLSGSANISYAVACTIGNSVYGLNVQVEQLQ